MTDSDISKLLYKKKHRTLPDTREKSPQAGSSSSDFHSNLEIDHNFEIKGFDRYIERQKKKALAKKPLKSDNLQLANYMNMGYYLITPLLLGVFFGLVLDNLFKTKPFFVLLLIFLGLVSTFYNLWRLIKEIK